MNASAILVMASLFLILVFLYLRRYLKTKKDLEKYEKMAGTSESEEASGTEAQSTTPP